MHGTMKLKKKNTRKPVNLDAGWTGPRAVAGYGDKEKNLEI